ncbi:MAG TPA: hypothetical protein PK975_03765 [Candidatus Hydrogenedentes bacterium]|nr:hypothetical protein [Candidatus Hydrogenedentota bacterium]HPO84777.1 hypothetical protein [Candidatus Hydrogenedentota bacterium]
MPTADLPKDNGNVAAVESSAIVYTYDTTVQSTTEEKPTTPENNSADEQGGGQPMEPIDADYLLPAEDGPARASDVAAVLEEVEALRRDVARLEQSVNIIMRSRISQLQEENRTLRRELQRLYTTGPRQGIGYQPPQVPAPGRDILEDIYNTVEEASSPEPQQVTPDAPLPPITAIAAPAAGPVQYHIMKEWGRTPEEAASLNASSLKGMVCVVPEFTSQDALVALGKSLRKEFDEYDNITIDVFNNPDAAQAYLESNASPGVHRVLTVTRHKNTQNDAIVIFRDGTPVPISPE